MIINEYKLKQTLLTSDLDKLYMKCYILFKGGYKTMENKTNKEWQTENGLSREFITIQLLGILSGFIVIICLLMGGSI